MYWTRGIVIGAIALAADAHATEAVWTIDAQAPEWVVEQSAPAHTALEGERRDVHYLLYDRQVRVEGPVEHTYERTVEQVASTAGVQDVDEISFDFDPSIEQLTIHHARLIRGAQTVDLLNPDDLKVVQQERDLDRRIYNGEVSVLAFPRDVRVGDVLDYAWTVEEQNPALSGHFGTSFVHAWGVPVGHMHHRLTVADSRSVHLQALDGAPEPVTTDADGTRTYTWSQIPAPGVARPSDAPPGAGQGPRTWISDFDDWQQVAAWAKPFYSVPEPEGELAEAIEGWRGSATDPLEQADTARRFVQDEVRYMGIEMGPRGLIPHAPAEVFDRRFGDCKDKAMLLVTALRKLGFEADPALVSTTRGDSIRALHPSLGAFNHAIVRVRVDGKSVWIDATRSLERGGLSGGQPPDFRWALVLSPETTDLEPIEPWTWDKPQVDVLERFTVHDWFEPVVLEVRSTYRGSEATYMRSTFGRVDEGQLGSHYAEFYDGWLSGVQADGPPSLTELDDGSVQTVERYIVPRFWQQERFRLVAWRLSDALPAVPETGRTAAIGVAHPRHVRHRVEVVAPESWRIEDDTVVARSSAIDATVRRTVRDRVLSLEATYQTKADRVEAADLSAHRAALEEAQHASGLYLTPDAIEPGIAPLTKALLVGFGLLALVAGAGWAGPALRRVRDSVRARQAAAGGGTSPEDALLVTSTSEAIQVLALIPCTCGAALDPLRRDSTQLRQDGASVLQIAMHCGSCPESTIRFFRFR